MNAGGMIGNVPGMMFNNNNLGGSNLGG